MARASQQATLARVVVVALLSTGLPSVSLAAPTAGAVAANQTVMTAKDAARHELVQQQVKINTARLQQLEQANQDALARNQELQLMNDNLTVQVQVLQSERSAQMFLYGAVTLGVGAFIGFLLANFMLSKTKRRW